MSTPDAKGPAADELFNPYRAPETSAAPPADGAAGELAILSHWERLRIAYNAMLGVEVVVLTLLLLPAPGRLVRLAGALPVYALAANVCFCAGPVATAYAHWIGLRGRAVPFALFVLGTLVSVPITAVVVALHLNPPRIAF